MNAQQLRNSILQEAIEGRLVPQDPNDEPASALLERIREEKRRLVLEKKIYKKGETKPIFEKNNYPFEIPLTWEWVQLSDVSIIQEGAGIRKYQYTKDGVQLLCVTNILNGNIDLSKKTLFISEKEYTEKYLHLTPQKGDIITACSGGSWGKIAVYDIDETVMLNTSTLRMRFFNDLANNKYLFYIAQSKFFKDQLACQLVGIQPNFGYAHYSRICFPLPPLAEQKRIVAKIEELMPKVEEYGKAQEALDKLNAELPEKLKKSILQEAIEGRLVPQDPNDEPASVLLDKIRKEKAQLVKEGKLKKKDLVETPISEDEIPFEIPESWEWVSLGDISTYSNTKKKINAAKADPNLWGLDLEDIEKGGRLLYFKTVGERKAIGDKTCFSEGEILYSKLRPYLLKILVAPKDGICTPEIIPFSCFGGICNDYIVSLLKSSYVDDYINSVTFGVKMPRVSTETMVSLVIPLPPLAEQKRIVAKIEELFAEVEKLAL